MKANTESIQGVFKNSTILNIPFYQRPYVWGQDNWDKFLSAMQELMNCDKNYFLGSVILKKIPAENGHQACFEVIDGQQRLTTLVIFSKILYTLAHREEQFRFQFLQEDTDKPILQPSRLDASDFNEIVNMELLSDVHSNGQIAKAYNYMRAYMREHGFAAFADTLKQRMNRLVEFCVIEVGENEDAQQIFESLNTLGLNLSTGEKLKNHLFGKDDIDLYDNCWAPVFEPSGNDYWTRRHTNGRSKSEKDSNIETFFYHFLQVMMENKDVCPTLSRADKDRYRKQDRLFDNYIDFMSKMGIDHQSMIHSIVRFAKLYKDNISDTVMDRPLAGYPSIARLSLLMNAAGFWTPVPYILYILDTVENTTEQDSIFAYLETYLVRRMICKSNNRDYANLFTEYLIGGGVKSMAALKSYVNDPSRGLLGMPTNEQVCQALKENDLRKEALVLLYLYESKRNAQFMQGTYDNSINDFVTEPVMPIKVSPNWPLAEGQDQESRKAICSTLGNFTLVRDGKLSAKTSSLPWSKKKSILKERCEQLEVGRVSNMPLWDTAQIAQRNAGFAEKFTECWRA